MKASPTLPPPSASATSRCSASATARCACPARTCGASPTIPERARRLLRRAVELGINFIDTAWYYGPFVANRLIVEALHPYPRDLVIATKLGGKRLPDKSWAPAARPEELRRGAEDDLRTLRLERLDVVHLRFMRGSGVPLDGVARRAAWRCRPRARSATSR